MDKQELVLTSLAKFLQANVPQFCISGVDDIVLQYLVGILEDVGCEDSFDVEDFKVMMEAYIPGFGDIQGVAICQWIFQLSEEVLSTTASRVVPVTVLQDESPSLLDNTELPEDNSSHSKGLNAPKHKKSLLRQRIRRKSNSVSAPSEDLEVLAEMFPDSSKATVKRCLSDSGGDLEAAIQSLLSLDDRQQETLPTAANKPTTHEAVVSEENVQLLLEMFPATTKVQARQCLSIAKGDLTHASQVLLEVQSAEVGDKRGLSLMCSARKCHITDDKYVKSSLLQKYGYVDTDDDRKDHRPVAPPTKEQKKMVRYINSKKVTLKGERFVDNKKPESEEMKKTYVNLKPARKYHFH